MIEKLNEQIHEFYNNKYLRNRYPSLSYFPSHRFFNGDCPDLAAVALGYKPAALWHENWTDANSDYITSCCYRGNELLYLDTHAVVVCERKDFDKYRAIFNKPNTSREWGELLGYPKHLIDLFVECSEGREIPDWGTYDAKAEEIALRLCMEID